MLHQRHFLILSIKKRIDDRINYFKKKIKFTCVNALHSTYLTALISCANFSPCFGCIGFSFVFCNLAKVDGSSRRSICVPTSKNGVFGQWCDISGAHY